MRLNETAIRSMMAARERAVRVGTGRVQKGRQDEVRRFL